MFGSFCTLSTRASKPNCAFARWSHSTLSAAKSG